MSFCTSPTVAANSAVAAPTDATTPMETGASAYRTEQRATM